MEAATAAPKQSPPEQAPAVPESVTRAAAGEKVKGKDERSALDWLLGATTALEYEVTVQYDTPAGTRPLTFRLRQVDASTFDRIDKANRLGDGPFAKLDVATFNAELLSEATVSIKDGSGRTVDPRGQEWLGGAPSPALAMALRFKYQPGLLDALVEEVRKISAYSPDRVGTAQRVLVDAVGGS